MPDFIVAAVFDRMIGRKLVTVDQVIATVARLSRRGRNGIGAARRILDKRVLGLSAGASPLEELFARVVADYDLAVPEFQHWVLLPSGWRRLDAAYVDERLAIEVDGFEHHSGFGVFDDDRARQNELILAGWLVLRFTDSMLRRAPAEVARAVLAALSTRRQLIL